MAYQSDYTGVFLPISVRFHAYLFIFIHAKTLLVSLLSLTYPHYVSRWCQYSNKIHGSIHIWVSAHLGEILRHLAWHLPQVFACYLPLISYIPLSLQTLHYGRICLLHGRKQTNGGKIRLSLWGISQYLSLNYVTCSNFTYHTQADLSSMNAASKSWSEVQKPHHDITYLLGTG